MTREINGYHVTAGMVLAFSVIIAVNITLAYNAIKTFPGLEVKNSYVASQNFDEERAAQLALGWTVAADVQDGILHLNITDVAGAPVAVQSLSSIFGRATTVRDDQIPEFVFDGTGYRAPVDITPGNWNLRFEAFAADGTRFHQRVVVIINR